MASETPKKLVDTDKCFACPTILQKKERVRLFGESKVDLPALLKSAINVNADVYKTSDLFICVKCYKRLVRFGKAKENLAVLQAEIKKDYLLTGEEKRRCKRLESTTDDERNEETFTSRKRLVFTQNVDQHEVPANRTVEALSPIAHTSSASHTMPAIIMNESSHTWTVSSTPIHPGFQQPTQSATPVNISVKYPSKTVKKILSPDFEMLGKALIHGPPSRIAKAIMKCKTINKLVVEQVLRTVSNEVAALCSRKNPSLLRLIKKEDLINFDLKLLCEEWEKRAPVFYTFLVACSSCGKTGQNVTGIPASELQVLCF